jgi:hypothetical protein
MNNFSICIPSIVFIIFSVLVIYTNLIEESYLNATVNFGLSTIIIFLLGALCYNGFSIISWFVLMSITLFLYLSKIQYLGLFVNQNKKKSQKHCACSSLSNNSNPSSFVSYNQYNPNNQNCYFIYEGNIYQN